MELIHIDLQKCFYKLNLMVKDKIFEHLGLQFIKCYLDLYQFNVQTNKILKIKLQLENAFYLKVVYQKH